MLIFTSFRIDIYPVFLSNRLGLQPSQKEIKAQLEDAQRKSAAEIEVLRDLLGAQKLQQERNLASVQAELSRALLKQSDTLIQHQQAIGALLATQEAVQQQQQSIDGLAAILEYRAEAQEQLERHMLQLTAKLEEQQKHFQAELLILKQHSLQSAQQITLLTAQTSQHEGNQQQLTLFIKIQMDVLESAADPEASNVT